MHKGRTLVAPGAISELGAIFDLLNARRVWLVTGEQSFEKSGAAALLDSMVEGMELYHYRQSPLVVRIEDLEPLVPDLRKFCPDLILAVGGGAVLDSSKVLSVLANYPSEKLFEKDLTKLHSIPLIAVPTTAGTGSEATCFAAVYREGRKYSVSSPTLLPEVAIVDANLTLSLPPYETACSGIDALSQAIESFWSRRSTEQSREFSRLAIELAYANLLSAVKEGGLDARVNMAHAAHLAGKAINIAGTTAPHAFSYGFTYNFQIPHGHAVALTLPTFFEYNSGVIFSDTASAVAPASERIAELCALLGTQAAADAASVLRSLIHDCGLQTALSSLKMSKSDLHIVADKVDPVRLSNNPRAVDQSEYLDILELSCR